jgi:hypothetical protein
MDANDGRKVAGWLPELVFEGAENSIVQVIEEATGEILYTVRIEGTRFQPRVYAAGKYTVIIGREKPNAKTIKGLEAGEKAVVGQRTVKL